MRSNGFPIPIIQSILIRMLLMPVYGSMVPVQVEGSNEQFQQIDDVGMDTVMFLGQIDDVFMGVIYIIFLFMENMYT
ncbi:hypothetical protein LOK49_LG06G01993 [Camellia lanceoleosa]|uniref:Uncharacterized protein n=1 Tax=Camellia lanceoleosa TaxID=1840588 RepID=A0ACC0HIS6_9ERIC|nr:hypothetical protein LOK49_LG06G01993 [Camellia lanceoleosa]